MNRHDQHRGIILYEYEIKAEWMFKTSNLHPWLYEFILQIRRVLIELNWIRYIRWNINIQNIFFAMFPKQTIFFQFQISYNLNICHSFNLYFKLLFFNLLDVSSTKTECKVLFRSNREQFVEYFDMSDDK